MAADSYGITALRMDDILHLKGVKLGGVIGIGAFGTVLRVEHDGKKYAAKRINESLLADKFTMRSLKDFCRKCSVIFNLTGGTGRAGNRRAVKGADNVVKYIGIYQEDVDKIPLLVMELMHSELRYLLHAHKETLTYRDKVNICHDIANGLNFLHSSEPIVLHRNLHSNNILLDKGLRAKIADLMNVRLIRPEDMLKKQITSVPGHEEYLAPEVLQDVRSYAAGSDVFSVGILIMEVFTHQPPRPLRNFKIPELQRREADLQHLPEDTSLLDVIHKCIKDQCSERPSAEELCDRLMMLKKTLKYGMSSVSVAQQASFSASLLDHQITWDKCSEMPAGVSSATAVRDSNGVIYIGGGWASNADTLSSIVTYNPHSDYWSALPSSPVQHARLATVAKKDSTRLILVGGILQADWITTDKLFTWEGAGKWKEEYPCMSTPRLTPAVCVYDNKYLIVAGGSGRDHSLDSIEVLELEKMKWSYSQVKLPHPMTEAVGSIAGDNFIIMATQSDEDVADSNKHLILSIPINAILGEAPVTITTLPPPPIPYSTLIQNIDPPLLLGGCSNTAELPGMYVYCCDLNNWKQVGTTTSNRANATGIILHNNAVLLLGGCHDAHRLSKETVIHSVEVGYL